MRMSLSTVLLPAPIPPPMKRRTGLRWLWATGTITSVHCDSSVDATLIAFSSSTKVLNTLATFRFFVTLSNLCFLAQRNFVRHASFSGDSMKRRRFYLKTAEMRLHHFLSEVLKRHGSRYDCI